MRHDAPLPAGQPLPLRGAHAEAGTAPVPLAPAAIAEFNDLLHELHPDAPHVDSAALNSMARWLDSLPACEAEALLQARLGRLEELRQMCEDRDWQLEPALARRIRRLLDYVDLARDLIPDEVPRLGRLDDALLVELAWPMVADELDDFRDFCRFRAENGGRADREQWLRSRLEEGALWEQLHRVRNQHYVDYGPLEGGLRVT
jgi:hypothetical protein